MTRRIILVGHANDEGDDRACAWAQNQGFEIDWRFPYDGDDLPAVDENIAGVIVYGGRFDVNPKELHPFLRNEARLIESAFKQDLPVLGFCLGAQIMADVLGAPVGPHPQGHAEYGYYPLIVSAEGRKVFGDGLTVLQSHWHGWHALPAGAVHLARTEHFPEQAFRYGRNAYALQFHPEASFATMSRWAARRSAERTAMAGAFTPERQLADHGRFDKPLGDWFSRFLDDWMVGEAGARQAAE